MYADATVSEENTASIFTISVRGEIYKCLKIPFHAHAKERNSMFLRNVYLPTTQIININAAILNSRRQH
jgi:hypothetical protein